MKVKILFLALILIASQAALAIPYTFENIYNQGLGIAANKSVDISSLLNPSDYSISNATLTLDFIGSNAIRSHNELIYRGYVGGDNYYSWGGAYAGTTNRYTYFDSVTHNVEDLATVNTVINGGTQQVSSNINSPYDTGVLYDSVYTVDTGVIAWYWPVYRCDHYNFAGGCSSGHYDYLYHADNYNVTTNYHQDTGYDGNYSLIYYLTAFDLSLLETTGLLTFSSTSETGNNILVKGSLFLDATQIAITSGQSVPEPATFVLVSLGLIGIGVQRIKKK